ncbi:hypothetical protein ABBQ38_008642 [Trebouxia sp. C0009 RCD-2024]
MVMCTPHAKVPVVRACTLQAGPWKGSMPTNPTHLQRQGWLKLQLPVRCLTLSNSMGTPAAKSKPAANAEAARAEFCRAGIPDEVARKVLKWYQPYLRWDIQTKLRPALQLWVEQLGSQQLSARLQKAPLLLCHTPKECSGVYLWLASIGADVERIQQKVPRVMARPLDQVQSTLWAIQQALQLRDDQLPAFLKRHSYCLLYVPEHVSRTLHTVAELLAVPVTSQDMQGVVMLCDERLFMTKHDLLSKLVSFFCEEFGGGQHAAKAALKCGIYGVSAETMKTRAAELRAMLGWTKDELKQVVNAHPKILTKKPSTVASNMQKLQAHSFSSAQAVHVYASSPSIAGYDWSSSANREKLMYLRHVLQLSQAEISSRPVLLSTSLAQKIGPRSEFIYAYQGISPDTTLAVSGLLSYIISFSDVRFAARFNNLSASPPLVYDDQFKRHWQQRWTFLVCEMGLSHADICACRPLLQTSLLNTLAPRWHFLILLETAETDFKAADHLIALATLSDEHFAQAFSSASMGLVYDQNFMHCARGNLCRFW